jgi:Family of unknown function (DUF5302)
MPDDPGTDDHETKAQSNPSEGSKPAAANDVREQFRLALERKQHQHSSATAAGASPDAKASAQTSNSKRQREFRRKSGG